MDVAGLLDWVNVVACHLSRRETALDPHEWPTNDGKIVPTISHDAPLDQEVLSCHCWKAKCFHMFFRITGHSCVIIFYFRMLVTSAQCSALLPTMCAAHVTSFRFFFFPTIQQTTLQHIATLCQSHAAPTPTLTADNWWPCGNVANNNIVSMAPLTFDCQTRENAALAHHWPTIMCNTFATQCAARALFQKKIICQSLLSLTLRLRLFLAIIHLAVKVFPSFDFMPAH